MLVNRFLEVEIEFSQCFSAISKMFKLFEQKQMWQGDYSSKFGWLDQTFELYK